MLDNLDSNECFICGIDKYHTQMVDSVAMDICWPCQNEIEAGIQMTVFKECRIEIAHRIWGHKTCGEIHGHSVKIVIGIRGFMDLRTGMVIDFNSIKLVLQKEIIKKFDHTCLNDILPIPTAEYLAFYIFKQLKFRNFDVVLVRIHETENNYVEYDGNTTFIDDDNVYGERRLWEIRNV
jgi:6-pyruvoyltetrahydropterin/6-carboxytetrahydropterin synthase